MELNRRLKKVMRVFVAHVFGILISALGFNFIEPSLFAPVFVVIWGLVILFHRNENQSQTGDLESLLESPTKRGLSQIGGKHDVIRNNRLRELMEAQRLSPNRVQRKDEWTFNSGA